MVSEASLLPLSTLQMQVSSADLLDRSSSLHLQGRSQFYTAHLSLWLPKQYFSKQYHLDTPPSGLLWTEEKTIWWYLYSSQIYGQERWSQTNGTTCGKAGLVSNTTSKKRCVTGQVHSSMGSQNLTPRMNLTTKSAGWIPCLSFRWVPNVPWFHSSLAKASQKNKACMLERHQMVTCL